ncbi:MAG: hypothetical protein AAF340_08985 [Pseudomonadota bacterium]
MLRILAMVAPILLPSWRFFKVIAPSPRLEWRLLDQETGAGVLWHPFRARPKKLAIRSLLWRVFWNPHWNETLFLVTCAERIAVHGDERAIEELRRRISADFAASGMRGRFLFRLVFVSRAPKGLCKEVLYISDPFTVQATP